MWRWTNYWFSGRSLNASLKRHLPNADFSDATALVNWRRAVKERGRNRIQCANAAAHRGGHACAHPRQGRGSGCACDLVAEIYGMQAIRGVEGPEGRIGGDYPAIVPFAAVRPSMPRLRIDWDETAMLAGRRGNSSRLPAATTANHCPLSGTVFLQALPGNSLDAEKASSKA